MKQTKIISADGGKWDLSADDTVALLQSLGVAACSGLGIAAPRSEEGRRGFGRVYLRDGSSSMKAMLARLGWRPTGPHEPAAKLNGCLYHDDPFQVGQPFALEDLAEAADIFVEEANEIFAESDGRFFARPVEVVPWQPGDGRSPEFYERDDGDVWVFDLMEGESRTTITGRIVADAYWEIAERGRGVVPVGHAEAAARHRFDCLNAVRKMFGGDLPELKAPAASSVALRLRKLRQRDES